MIRTNNYFFLAMLFLATLTVVRYRHIMEYRNSSKEFTFVVSGDQESLFAAKSDISKMTLQSVEHELIGQGLYRLKFRCPPDDLGRVQSKLERMSLAKEGE